MDKVQAYHNFWSGFGLTAYDENTVPDDALTINDGKYITYEMLYDEFGSSVSLTVSVWYKGYSWEDVTLKVQEISDTITRGGIVVAYDDGAMWIHKGSPWAMRMAGDSDQIRRIMLNVEVEFID